MGTPTTLWAPSPNAHTDILSFTLSCGYVFKIKTVVRTIVVEPYSILGFPIQNSSLIFFSRLIRDHSYSVVTYANCNLPAAARCVQLVRSVGVGEGGAEDLVMELARNQRPSLRVPEVGSGG